MSPYSAHAYLNELVKQAEDSLARSRLLVVSGPTGSGKTWLVGWLHRRVCSGKTPLLYQEAAGLEANRFESQLFGHVKGAFTGATQSFRGLFGETSRGTLCIEGLQGLGDEGQAKLLRVLQTRDYRPVGSTLEHQFHGLLVFTSHEPMSELLKKGLLREDFYYRLASLEIQLPAIAQRLGDLAPICRQMAADIVSQTGLPLREPTEADWAWLKKNLPQGNFHGLRNLIQQAMIRGIPMADLPKEPEPLQTGLPSQGSLKKDLLFLEKQLLKRALRLYPHSRGELAKHLGVSLRSLMYKLKQHQLN